jgi:hypothetical protein
MASLPVEIAGADPRVVRPRDLAHRYLNPRAEFNRLAEAGVLLRLAHGYYALVPEPLRGTAWRPSVEAAGLALAQTDYGRDRTVAMGVTAARLLAVVPRAPGTSVIAVPRQRAPLDTVVGRVVFVTRAVEQLDAQRVETELSTGLTTTAEQTLLDLADRPELGGLSRHEVVEAIQRLAEGADWDLVGELAVVQRKRPAAMQAAGIAGVRPPVTASRPPRPWGVSTMPGPRP